LSSAVSYFGVDNCLPLCIIFFSAPLSVLLSGRYLPFCYY
jgi:hypothetical protein